MIGRRMITATAVIAAVASGGIAGAVIGIPGLSGASTTSTSAPKTAKVPDKDHARHGFGVFGAGKGVLDAGAKALNLTTADLLKKLADGKTTIADVATQQHVPLQTVIDAMDAVAKADITDMVNNPFPKQPSFKGGKGGPGFGGFGGHGGRGFGFGGGSFGDAAKALGIAPKDLMTDLAGGTKSVADIAKSKNINVDTLITTLVNNEKTDLAAAVKAGHLKQDVETKIEAGLKDRITKFVNGKFKMGDHFGGKFGPGHGGPMGGSGPKATTAPA